jgi:hypothetical protein
LGAGADEDFGGACLGPSRRSHNLAHVRRWPRLCENALRDDHPFVIENRAGAGSNIATEAVAKAPPDGYTLLIITASNAGNAALYNKLNFDLIRDIAPVASISRIWLKTGQYQVVRLALAGDRWKGRPNTL